MTIIEQVLERAIARLNGAGKPGGVPTTERARGFAIPSPGLASSICYAGKTEVLNPTTPRRPAVQLGVGFVVEIRTKGDGVTSPDALALVVFDWVIKALCFSLEPGLWLDVEFVAMDPEYGQVDYPYCFMRAEFRALSQMKTNDASAIA